MSWRDSATLGAQGAHPVRGARDRAAQTPAHNQQRDERDDDHLHQHAQKRVAPDLPRLCRDVASVVDNRQAADDMVVVVQRHHVDMEGCRCPSE